MQYKQSTKIIIDKRKLDLLFRIGCPDKQLIQVLKTGKFDKTGDQLIDDTLECLVDIKEFDNWGGKRQGAGRKPNNHLDNQLENQDENHLANQEPNQDVDIDKDRDKDKKIVDISSLKKWGGIGSKQPNKIMIKPNFNIYEIPQEQLKPFIEAYGDGMARKIQDWLRWKKSGQAVEISRILSLFYKFYQRENGR